MELINWDKVLENLRTSTDPQEQPVIMHCDKCLKEIYKGEEYYDDDVDFLCEDCFDKWQEEQKEICKRIAGENFEN